MSEKFALMFVLLIRSFANTLRYVRAQMNKSDDQGTQCVNNGYSWLVFSYRLIFCKQFSICSVKAAKDDADIYTTDNGRIPQNLMRVGERDWFSKRDRVVKFTMYPVLQGEIIRGVP